MMNSINKYMMYSINKYRRVGPTLPSCLEGGGDGGIGAHRLSLVPTPMIKLHQGWSTAYTYIRCVALSSFFSLCVIKSMSNILKQQATRWF